MDPKKPSYTNLGRVTNTALKNTKEIDTYGHLDLHLFVYLTGIVLYVVSFIFLFKRFQFFPSLLIKFSLHILKIT